MKDAQISHYGDINKHQYNKGTPTLSKFDKLAIRKTQSSQYDDIIKSCKDTSHGNVKKRSFLQQDFLQKHMPPQSMQNEVCMKALQGSDGNLEVLDKQICRHRFVFIMGLHHSGT
eukprot:CAMPEP_0194358066 /NCGR_PEP_ID=MMETSP0174-20130528/5414_1 /TAXON_ID=216777 /ORGANISM="Proboscia alata, Strain PI-D3" /LENGTH=114 /DNA_ID=CAMNT_0039128293 /DNA_START=212 /DNA_END=552 /DNA_ORIENTATION=-